MDVIREIRKTVKRSTEKDDAYSFDGRLMHTTIAWDDTGFYTQSMGTDPDLETVKTYVNEEAHGELRNAVEKATDLVTAGDNFESSSTRMHFYRSREEKVFVSVSFESEIHDEGTLFNRYVDDFTRENGNHSSASKNTMKGIDIRNSFSRDGFTDCTCYYRTDKPHEVYSNIDTLEEYAEMIAEQNSEYTKEELLDEGDFTSHYHPTGNDSISEVLGELRNRHSDSILRPDYAGFVVESVNIMPDKYTVKLSAYIPLGDLI